LVYHSQCWAMLEHKCIHVVKLSLSVVMMLSLIMLPFVPHPLTISPGDS
jgi:hypothetical protein